MGKFVHNETPRFCSCIRPFVKCYILYIRMTNFIIPYPNLNCNKIINQPESFLSSLLKKKEDCPQISKWESKRSRQKEKPHILYESSYNIWSLFSFRDYSNSWAERFIWLFLGTHLCILFFIFILFRIFVYLF